MTATKRTVTEWVIESTDDPNDLGSYLGSFPEGSRIVKVDFGQAPDWVFGDRMRGYIILTIEHEEDE